MSIVTPNRPEEDAVNAATRKVSEQLVRKLGERKYGMWFGSNTRLNARGDRLEVRTASPSVAEWIGRNFANDLQDAAVAALGDAAEVDVQVDAALARETVLERPPQPSNGNSVQRPSRSRQPINSFRYRHRLEDFIVGESNRLAYNAAVHLAEAPDRNGLGPLFIHGECGLGKTHLLQGTCRRHQERFPDARLRYTSGEQFTNEYIASIKSNGLESFRKRVRRIDLLAIDDVHFLSNKTATQSEFLHTLNAIEMSGARVILASDAHPKDLRDVNKALISRFMAGLVANVTRPERQLRLELVQRLAASRGLVLNEQAVERVAAECIGSVREIEGALTKLSALVLLDGRRDPNEPIGCVMVEQLLKCNAGVTRPLRIALIVDVVCDRLRVDRSDLLGSTRHRKVVLARSLVSYLAREMTTLSYPEIGRALGRRNHSTVLTAGKRLAQQIEDGETIQLDTDAPSISYRELADQMRHEVKRASRE